MKRMVYQGNATIRVKMHFFAVLLAVQRQSSPGALVIA
jgi:hypothetical protein